MSSSFIIYGATGYTGTLITHHAVSLGLLPTLAARTIPPLASSLALPSLIFPLNDPSLIDAALSSPTIKLLLNCAGPYHRTAAPLIAACIRTNTHYLDIAAELDSYKLAALHDAEAREKRVMLLPGAGGSVAMLGSLAARAMASSGDVEVDSLDMAMAVAGPMSRGSIKSAAEGMGGAPLQRAGGLLVPSTSGNRAFDFGDGQGAVEAFPVTLPDLMTVGKAMGVENVRTYVRIPSGGFPELEETMDGPSLEEREGSPYRVAVVATGDNGTVREAVLKIVNGYTFTALASVEAVRRVLDGEFEPGWQVPVSIFGAGFAESIEGSVFEVLGSKVVA